MYVQIDPDMDKRDLDFSELIPEVIVGLCSMLVEDVIFQIAQIRNKDLLMRLYATQT